MLKQFKIITLAPTCFGSRRNHHQGAVLCLAKTTKNGFFVIVGIDVVNVLAAYQPVVQACSSQWRQELSSLHFIELEGLFNFHNGQITRIYTSRFVSLRYILILSFHSLPSLDSLI